VVVVSSSVTKKNKVLQKKTNKQLCGILSIFFGGEVFFAESVFKFLFFSNFLVFQNHPFWGDGEVLKVGVFVFRINFVKRSSSRLTLQLALEAGVVAETLGSNQIGGGLLGRSFTHKSKRWPIGNVSAAPEVVDL